MAPPRSPAHVALGRAIRDLRVRRDISQEQLALRSGLQRKTIHQMEGAKTDPRYGSLLRVATALDVRLVELIELVDELDEGAGRARRL